MIIILEILLAFLIASCLSSYNFFGLQHFFLKQNLVALKIRKTCTRCFVVFIFSRLDLVL